jgi:pimeloyl-ACP methyl ester carboxylesterase
LALIVLLAASGATYEAIMTAGDAKRYPPPGQLVDVGGHRLHLHCVGEGSPTVVLDAGLGAFSLDWGAVQPQIATSTRVCAYDRAGLGWSEPGPLPRSPQQFADELHVLLTNAGVEGPYVLVVLSGKTARLFASQHPNDVAGMVLVDARHESVDEHVTPEQLATESAEQRRFQRMIGWMAKFGLVRLLWAPAWPRVLPGSESLSPETRTAIGVLQARPRQIENALAEGQGRMDSNTQLEAAEPLGDIPLIVLASAQSIDRLPFWNEAQQIMTGAVVQQPHDRRLERPRCSFRAARAGGGEHSPGRRCRAYRSAVEALVSWNPSSFALGVVQVRACRRKATRGVDTQGRRRRDTGSYVDRGERREVRAWAARSVKRLGFHGTGYLMRGEGEP